MNRHAALACVMAIALGAVFGSALGAETVRLPMEYRAWTLRDSTGHSVQVTQSIAPMVATVTIAPRSSLVLSTALISSTREFRRDRTSLRGATDLNAQLFHDLAPEHLTLTAGVSLPTGKATLDSTDLTVARALDPPLLGMRARRYGRGFAWNLGLAWTTALSARWGLGLCSGFRDFASYTLAAGQEKFSGAPEVSFSTGLRYRGTSFASGSREMDLRLIARNFGDDEIGDRVAFKQSAQIEAAWEGRLSSRAFDLASSARLTLGGRGTYYELHDGKNVGHAAELGTFSSLALRAERGLGERWRAGLGGEWRGNGGSDLHERNGYSIAAGPCLTRSLGQLARVRVDARYLHGRFGEGAAQLDGSGIALSLALLWTVRA